MAAATRITARTLLIAGVFALVIAALFIREGEPSITFALENGINLTIGSEASRNGVPIPGATWALKDLVPGSDKFFDIADVKPGDFGEAAISLRVNGRESAWLCLDFSNLRSDDNGVNEPESSVDSNGEESGELATGMEFFAWRDDGDNIFEVGETPIFGEAAQSASVVLDEKTYAIVDSATGLPVQDGGERHIGMLWCAGDLTVDTATAEFSCAGSALGNEAQTDSFSVDVALRAEGSQDRGAFTCAGGFNAGDRERGEREERSGREARSERPSR